MSVTSSTTASQDWEVPSPDSLQDKLLVVSITKGDGTPLDASSITEEDMVEICVRRAHTCPLGVLQYSAVESVVLFGNVTDVNRTHCVLPDVMEFQDKAVTVQTMAPIEAQVTAFQAMWHSNLTAGDGELHTPPYRTPPDEETPCHIHAQLGDLNYSELQWLIRDLLQEIVQCKLTAPPATPLLKIGHACWALVYQRRMTRRSPFWEGEGSLLDHHCNHQVLHWQDQTWGSSSMP